MAIDLYWPDSILGQCLAVFTRLIALEQIELPAKLLDYFLWSNKSNINRLVNISYDSSSTSMTNKVPSWVPYYT